MALAGSSDDGVGVLVVEEDIIDGFLFRSYSGLEDMVRAGREDAAANPSSPDDADSATKSRKRETSTKKTASASASAQEKKKKSEPAQSGTTKCEPSPSGPPKKRRGRRSGQKNKVKKGLPSVTGEEESLDVILLEKASTCGEGGAPESVHLEGTDQAATAPKKTPIVTVTFVDDDDVPAIADFETPPHDYSIRPSRGVSYNELDSEGLLVAMGIGEPKGSNDVNRRKSFCVASAALKDLGA